MEIITENFKTLYKIYIDEMFRQGSLSVPCKLIYDASQFTECENCIIDPISHKSSNLYKAGGPNIFSDGQICPHCRGLGGYYNESYNIVFLLAIFDYKYWINFNSKIHSPDGLVQTINKLEDLTKIQSCNKIIVDTNIQDYTNSYFQRNSDPQPCGLGDNNYFFTFWKKI